MNVVTKAAANLNGISIAYAMAVANALFACLVAFGVHLSDQEIATMLVLMNSVLAFAMHISHRVGQATASGASTARSAEDFGSPSPPAQIKR